MTAAVIAAVLGVMITWLMAAAVVIGAIMSALAGYIGMKIATYSNVRVTNKARITRSLGETLKVAYRGGTVMGMCDGRFTLHGNLNVNLDF